MSFSLFGDIQKVQLFLGLSCCLHCDQVCQLSSRGPMGSGTITGRRKLPSLAILRQPRQRLSPELWNPTHRRQRLGFHRWRSSMHFWLFRNSAAREWRNHRLTDQGSTRCCQLLVQSYSSSVDKSSQDSTSIWAGKNASRPFDGNHGKRRVSYATIFLLDQGYLHRR